MSGRPGKGGIRIIDLDEELNERGQAAGQGRGQTDPLGTRRPLPPRSPTPASDSSDSEDEGPRRRADSSSESGEPSKGRHSSKSGSEGSQSPIPSKPPASPQDAPARNEHTDDALWERRGVTNNEKRSRNEELIEANFSRVFSKVAVYPLWLHPTTAV